MNDLPGRLRKATGLDLDLKREAAAEIERLRLTDAEREAIERACRVISSTMPYESQQGAEDYQTLRSFLERTK